MPNLEKPIFSPMKQQSVFFPNLDGLRFFSFFVVFLSHSFVSSEPDIVQSAWYQVVKGSVASYSAMGVSFFFVLSGFLISYLLLLEKENNGGINVPYFYLRRVLRIWPVYYVIVIFGFFIFPFIKGYMGQSAHETASLRLCATFLNNFNNIKNGVPDASCLAVLWSVAIEEQFYLVWPLLLFKTPKKYYLAVMSGVVGISTLFRMLSYKTTNIDEHTLGVITDMAMGGIGAYLMIYNQRPKRAVENLPRAFLAVLYAIVVALMCVKDLLYYNTAVWILNRLLMSTVFITIILEQNFCRQSLFKVSSLGLVSRLGKYTYGLYCYHMIAILAVSTLLGKFALNHHSWQIWLLELPLSLLLSVGISYISYHYFERFFLALKDRFVIVRSNKVVKAKPAPVSVEMLEIAEA